MSNAKRRCDDCSYMLDTALAGCLARFFQGHGRCWKRRLGSVTDVPHSPRAGAGSPGPWLALLTSHPLTQGLALSPEPDGRRRAAVSRGRSGEIDPAPLTTQAHAHRARRGDRALCQGHPGVGPHGQGHRLRHLPLPLTLTLALTLALTLTLTLTLTLILTRTLTRSSRTTACPMSRASRAAPCVAPPSRAHPPLTLEPRAAYMQP